jgi:hypothetical protein
VLSRVIVNARALGFPTPLGDSRSSLPGALSLFVEWIDSHGVVLIVTRSPLGQIVHPVDPRSRRRRVSRSAQHLSFSEIGIAATGGERMGAIDKVGVTGSSPVPFAHKGWRPRGSCERLRLPAVVSRGSCRCSSGSLRCGFW